MIVDQLLYQDLSRVSRVLCFRDTRVPVAILFDYLDADGLASFLDLGPESRFPVNWAE